MRVRYKKGRTVTRRAWKTTATGKCRDADSHLESSIQDINK